MVYSATVRDDELAVTLERVQTQLAMLERERRLERETYERSLAAHERLVSAQTELLRSLEHEKTVTAQRSERARAHHLGVLGWLRALFFQCLAGLLVSTSFVVCISFKGVERLSAAIVAALLGAGLGIAVALRARRAK